MADMPQMVDMAYTKKEIKEEQQEARLGEPSPYPWGLCIRLESEELDKLGVKDLPAVGAEVHFMAVATVTGVNQSARVGQDDERSVALQITMLQIMGVESAAEEKAEGKDTPAKESQESGSMMGKYKG
jgi:hypothetical protein